MGTLSKNFDRFGRRIGDRVGGLRANVGHQLDDIGNKVSWATESGALTRGLERVTSALPTDTWLALAGASVIGSLALQAFGKHKAATFIGQCAPTFLLLGLYTKLRDDRPSR